MKNFFAEFKKFITRGNVVDMAIGVAVAGAFTKIVNAFTNGFVSPIVGLITGGANLTDQKWILREAEMQILEDGTEKVVSPEVAFLWGNFVQMIIDFLIIALCIFMMVKVVSSIRKKAEALKKKEEEQKPAEPPKPSKEEELLTEIRDLLKAKN